ncbi:MAG: bifunctional (p)ppGpp synthetase/guanosine-3',5'-bis(diphosphate) 3'-pyrophosphohydrolase [Bdellovibrionaceae bacterium]|nr:bifunctional (p)ppGpp synthetase/guanosine-3',5'-bis(diphosphate) 3'-pyrophosphohydrolase [Pseudobdellovibrionaceae bacterium]
MLDFAAGEKLPDKHIRSLEELCDKILAYHPQADLNVVRKAYDFSEKAHAGQIRRSGEAYISHPLSVAGILADLRLDLDSIITGLLHDTVEDTSVTIQDVKAEFGEAVSHLVDGVTKISKMNFKTSTERQGENIRKMIVAMGKDVRVILVKLCDRLHNMRTLNHMPYEKQARIALETLEIYAPLASRLGISSLKTELEDLSFRYYRPDQFYQLSQKVDLLEKDQARYIDDVKRIVSKELEGSGFRNFEVLGRSKHLWSIYRKMTNRNIDFEQVNDVLAFRVIVDTISQCYEVLGHVHSIWKPIPGRFKDFIAMPKANDYQSLHTTVVGPGGERIEIQIRTKQMNLIAERGIAAHWKYKERGKVDDETSQKFDWLRDLLNWQSTVRDADELLDTVKTDLFESEIYVFTPKGDVKEFPDGATPLDFAYSVHTDVGHKCVGARINGKMVPLKYRLKNGDSVEIVTSNTQAPSKDWLKMCVTNRAKSKIRAFVKEEQRKRSLILGKELVDREFRKFGAAASRYVGKGEEWAALLKDFGLHNDDEVFVRVGYGKMEPKHILERLAPELKNLDVKPKEESEPSFMQKVLKNAQAKSKKSGSLISVSGMDDVLVYYAKCCNPIPGDGIVGFITRGRGITVHRSDCRKAFEFDQDRRVDVAWTQKSAEGDAERLVKIQVFSQNVQGLLKLMSEAFSAQGMNIQNVNARTTRDQKAIATFEVTVRNTEQLNNVILGLQKIKGVLGVSRVTDT